MTAARGPDALGEGQPPEHRTVIEISKEVVRARTKFPGNRFMLAALTEEVGELAQALLQKKDAADIRREAIQVAAVAIRIIEEGDASFADMTDAEANGERCPWSNRIGYDCELAAGHDGTHMATDIDGKSKVGWGNDHAGNYRRPSHRVGTAQGGHDGD